MTLTLTGPSPAPTATLSNGSGNYQFSSLPSGGSYTVTPTKTTLAPGTAGINTVDVIGIQRHFLLIGTPLSGCRLTAADVMASTGSILLTSLRFSDSSSNCQPGPPIPENTSSLPRAQLSGIISDQTGQNYNTLVFGDVLALFISIKPNPKAFNRGLRG